MADGRTHDLIVVGMGSGGLVAAEFAVKLGVKVVVVERDRVGGDCLWTGCVPSKALLASAKAAHTMRHADAYGLTAVEPVTAWRIIAAQTIDARIAALIDDKAGLAAAALDGSEEEVGSSTDAQHATLVALLTDALSA